MAPLPSPDSNSASVHNPHRGEYILAKPIPCSAVRQRLNILRTSRQLVFQIQETYISNPQNPRIRSTPLYNIYEPHSGGLLSLKPASHSNTVFQLCQFDDPRGQVAELRSSIEPSGSSYRCSVTFKDGQKWDGFLGFIREGKHSAPPHWCLRICGACGFETVWRGQKKSEQDGWNWSLSIETNDGKENTVLCVQKREKVINVLEKKLQRVVRGQWRGEDGGCNREDDKASRIRDLVLLTGAYLHHMEALTLCDAQ